MDDDADGMIKVDHVLKVIELLARENIELSAKQINKIVDMMEMEDAKDVEDDLTDVLAKSSPDPNGDKNKKNTDSQEQSDFDEEELAKAERSTERSDEGEDSAQEKQAMKLSPPKEKE